MSSINGVGGNNPLYGAQQITSRATPPAGESQSTGRTSAADRLELSGASGFLQTLKTNGDVRADKVASIKAQIDAGTYDADGTKLDGALDGLLDDLTK